MSKSEVIGVVALVVVIVIVIALMMWGLPKYRIYKLELQGKADLKEAEWSKQILIEEARALRDAAKLRAEAEVERARGVAEANQIIGDSLENNDAYLRYLWIQGLHDGSSEVIYIPTEGNLPILEATRNVR